jgi:hypothetical protein
MLPYFFALSVTIDETDYAAKKPELLDGWSCSLPYSTLKKCKDFLRQYSMSNFLRPI